MNVINSQFEGVETEVAEVVDILSHATSLTYPHADAICRMSDGRVLFWGAFYEQWYEQPYPYYMPA